MTAIKNVMYSIRLEQEFIQKLSPEGKSWLARAVVNMINIDGKLDPNEMPYMHDAVLLINENERNMFINKMTKNKMRVSHQDAGALLKPRVPGKK